LRPNETVEIFYEKASTGIYLDGSDIQPESNSLTVTKSAKMSNS
jgi:hypothetical protein